MSNRFSDARTISITKLERELCGRVIAPDDTDYDEARSVFHGGFDRRPAVIARVADADDVTRIVSLARESGLELAIRGGGHSGAGHGVSEGGIVLDLRQLRALELDLDQRTAWAETGLTTGEYTRAVGAHRLATGFGDAPTVGIGGITLGGGIGFLSRKYGLTIDNLLAAEIVTADGRLLHVDEGNHADLFWAIRGGGGNFGVATRLQFRLHELSEVVGGTLLLPATPEVIASFVAAAEAAPDELSTIANVMPAPPLPFVPAELHGRLVVMSTLAYAGPREAGERAIAPFRELAEPLADMVRPLPYPEMFPPEQSDFHPISSARTMFVDSIAESDAEAIVERLGSSTAAMSVCQLRVLGGAIGRVPEDATAYAHRKRRIMVNLVAVRVAGEDPGPYETWVADLAAALHQGHDGAYVNFLGGEGEERIWDAYPGRTGERLRAIKGRYDPANLFRLNQNIPPTLSRARERVRAGVGG